MTIVVSEKYKNRLCIFIAKVIKLYGYGVCRINFSIVELLIPTVVRLMKRTEGFKYRANEFYYESVIHA